MSRRYRAYLFDLDGTLYRGGEALPGAVETVCELRARGAAVRYLTNNSGLTLAAFAEKLAAMGFPAAPEEVINSGVATAGYLRERGHRTAFVVGEPGLVATLRAAGIEVANAGPDDAVTEVGGVADAVVVGIHRRFTYGFLSEAMGRIRRGAEFVATNPDTTFPLEGDRLVPGAGSIVAAVRACSETDPVVIGKPEPRMVLEALAETGVPPEETLVVGDRLDTDIECGRRAGCPTHLVLTGVSRVAPPGQPASESLLALLD